MNRHSGSIVRYGIVLVVVMTLVASAGVASAAVAGTFSSTYDGYDGSETSVRGHEIQVSGTLEVSGESAVNPRIEITSTQNTVLDDGTVTLLQPGDSSANFERRYSENGVTYTADEIPPGTTLNLEFVVYPVAGLTSGEITSAQVVVTYARPGGDRTRETFDVSTSLSATAPQAITAAEQRTPEPSAPGPRDWAIRGLAALGALMLVFILLVFVWNVVSGDDDDDGSPLD
jgi:hypothetical protein